MVEMTYSAMREQMVEEVAAHTRVAHEHIGKEALDPRVTEALVRVPRHEFVPVEIKPYAYVNSPLPIGCGKTISQPFIVALMTDLLEVGRGHRVLEVGTGLGYQAAVLAELAGQVYTVETIEELAGEAKERLGRLGYANIETRVGDGYQGWPEHGPFDRIMVTAAPDLIPPPLLHQLKAGGRMVIPTGIPEAQQLTLVTKDERGRTRTESILPVRFSVLETDEQMLT